MNESRRLLSVENLNKKYSFKRRGRRQSFHAVRGVSFEIFAGECVALVGESGSGKSTIARCLTGLTDYDSGQVLIDGVDLRTFHGDRRSALYRQVQMVFQDTGTSLNPQRSVASTVQEPLRLLRRMSGGELEAETRRLLDSVDLAPELMTRRPRELSGGQRQRVGIARALAAEPRLLLLDEPTSSLDVSVRGSVLRMLRGILEERQLGYLFITHDLQAVQHIADRVIVMRKGMILESGPAAEVFDHPQHPYTRCLLSAAPSAHYGATKLPYRFDPRPLDAVADDDAGEFERVAERHFVHSSVHLYEEAVPLSGRM